MQLNFKVKSQKILQRSTVFFSHIIQFKKRKIRNTRCLSKYSFYELKNFISIIKKQHVMIVTDCTCIYRSSGPLTRSSRRQSTPSITFSNTPPNIFPMADEIKTEKRPRITPTTGPLVSSLNSKHV